MASTSFGARLTLLRQNRRLSVTELARRAELDPMQVRRYEAGKTFPTFDSAVRIAKVLEVPLDELAGRPANPAPAIRNDRLLARMQRLDQLPAGRQELALQVLDSIIAAHELEELSERLRAK